MIPKSNVLMSLFQKQTSFSSQMNKIVSYKQIGKAIEFALGNFVENKFCGKEFEEYEYREDNIVRHSFRNNKFTFRSLKKLKNNKLNVLLALVLAVLRKACRLRSLVNGNGLVSVM